MPGSRGSLSLKSYYKIDNMDSYIYIPYKEGWQPWRAWLPCTESEKNYWATLLSDSLKKFQIGNTLFIL
jgi:hypothetical protein